MNHPVAAQYVGFAIAEREENRYDDSYFHLTVWNPETAKPEWFMYAATAFPSHPMHPDTVRALLAETFPSVRQAFDTYITNTTRARAAKHLDSLMNETVFKGDSVTVTRGRKVPKGTTGKVINVEERAAYVGNYTERWALVVTESGASWSVKCEYCTVLARGPVAQELFDLSC